MSKVFESNFELISIRKLNIQEPRLANEAGLHSLDWLRWLTDGIYYSSFTLSLCGVKVNRSRSRKKLYVY